MGEQVIMKGTARKVRRIYNGKSLWALLVV
jgi:ATP-dependent protease HslVU (ClpYQ) peptidase subunit